MDVSKEQELLDWGSSNCWFCGQRPPAHGLSRPVKMLKAQAGEGGGMSFLHSSVAVPRCAECYAGHQRVNRIAFAAVAGGALVVFLVVVVWNPIEMAGWLKGVLILLGAGPGGLLIGGTGGLPAGQKPEAAAVGFKAVKEMERGGWRIDDASLKRPGEAR